ncbi:hypothetical protein Tco_0946292 [Tanacetum coccineum]
MITPTVVSAHCHTPRMATSKEPATVKDESLLYYSRNWSSDDKVIMSSGGKKIQGNPKAAKKSELLAFTGAAKCDGMILLNFQSFAMLSIQSLT